MLRIDESSRKFVAPREGTLISEGLLERGDIQEMIANSWESVARELGFPNLRLINTEVRPHDSVANRIDILAFDEDLSRPVIIELKRNRHKLQLLQALTYAAMCATWGADDLKDKLQADADEDLINSVENLDPDASPAIVLVAEDYDPEVMLTADWLSRRHGLDIYCFSLSVNRFGTDLLVRFQLDYPLRQLDELYRARRSSVGVSRRALPNQDWEDVKRWVNYSWGADFIDYCLRIKPGDARRRRFGHVFLDDWSGYYIVFQKEHATVVSQTRKDGDVGRWKAVLPTTEIGEWGSEETRRGLRFWLTSPAEVDAFLVATGNKPVDWSIDT